MKKVFFIVSLICVFGANAQNREVRFHSHNDYNQNVPFWNAYSQGMHSIEVDLVLIDNNLFVAHDIEDRQVSKTLESLYLLPLHQAHTMKFGNLKDLQFLIDLKGDGTKSIDLLVPILKRYESLIIQHNIQFVISGNKPKLSYFSTLPSYIKIDLQVQDNILDNLLVLDKIALISYNFQSISTWNGKGKISSEDKKKLKQLIDKAHEMNKPIRFWATPDTEDAWQELSSINVDFINTDNPGGLQSFMKGQVNSYNK